jgi:hypothetical protein
MALRTKQRREAEPQGTHATRPKKPAAARSAKRNAVSATAAPKRSANGEVDPLDIARLAYHIWEAEGRRNGTAEDDWLRAEAELLRLSSVVGIADPTLR